MTLHESEFFDLETLTGPMRTHVFRPAAPGKYPGLVLWSEIYQMTGPIQRTAAFLAGHGYVVAVPEIYHEFAEAGEAFEYDEAGTKRGNDLKTTKGLAAYDSDARAALDFLANFDSCTGKLGTIGICIGGHLAFRTAFNPDVLASVCFYATDIHKRSLGRGLNDDSLDRFPEIQGELLMIWGRQDPHIPREGRQLIYNALTDHNLNFQWMEFNAAHAFMRDIGPRYNPELAQICYQMVLQVFARKLGEGDVSLQSE